MIMTSARGEDYHVKETHTWGRDCWVTSMRWSPTSDKREKVDHHISEKTHKPDPYVVGHGPLVQISLVFPSLEFPNKNREKKENNFVSFMKMNRDKAQFSSDTKQNATPFYPFSLSQLDCMSHIYLQFSATLVIATITLWISVLKTASAHQTPMQYKYKIIQSKI